MEPRVKFRKTTSKTVARDLRAFADWLESDGAGQYDRKRAAADLNETLNALYVDDAFGTDGQLDPRGRRE